MENKPRVSAEDDDEPTADFKNTSEAPQHIGAIMDRLLRPKQETLTDDEDDDEEEESPKDATRRSGRLSRSFRKVFPSLVTKEEPPVLSSAPETSPYAETDTQIAEAQDHLPQEFDQSDMLNIDHTSEVGSAEEPSGVPATETQADYRESVAEEPIVEPEDYQRDAKTQEGEVSPPEQVVESVEANEPPEPPVPPRPTSNYDEAANRPPVPPEVVSVAPTPPPPLERSPVVPSTSLEQASQIRRAESWGRLGVVAAIAVDFMSRRRDRKIRREQTKTNRRLEKMIDQKNKKTTQESDASRPNTKQDRVLTPRPVSLEGPPVPPTPPKRTESLKVPSPLKTTEQMPASAPHNQAESTIPPLNKVETTPMLNNLQQSEDRNISSSEKPTQTQKYESETGFNLPHAERVAMPETIKETSKIPEVVFEARHEVMDKDGQSDTLKETASKHNDSQPVTHISNVLADSHFRDHSDIQQTASTEIRPAGSTDINKQYVKAGFLAAIVIVAGVILILSLR